MTTKFSLIHLLFTFILFFSCKSSEGEIISTSIEREDEKVLKTELTTAEIESAEDIESYAKTTLKTPPSTSFVARESSKLEISADYLSEPAAISMAKSTETRTSAYHTREIEAGQITAGEWNDLNRWDAWDTLLTNKDYHEMQSHWGIYPRSRYSVIVKNKYELPIQNARLALVNQSNKKIWEARTDNSGKAELWACTFDSERSFGPVDLEISYNQIHLTVEDIRSIEEGVNHVIMNAECRRSNTVDIFFAVDATGSMGDEISYLQTELYDVIKRAALVDAKLEWRTGAVFYRDNGDEYVTRTQAFDSDMTQTLGFISEQTAHGGGDYPEAVEMALDEALAQDWSDDAVAKLLFLVLDAPPHEDEQVKQRIRQQIADAATEGIKLIPITASGINRQTEFLMKFMSVLTNGTYVFITDHSGIGGNHLEPLVLDYEVEKLNDLLVRLLRHYTKENGCNPNDPVTSKVSVYPNPTSNFVHLHTEVELEKVQILGNSGKVMKTMKDLAPGENRIDLDFLVDGVYTIHCLGPSIEYSIPVFVVSS